MHIINDSTDMDICIPKLDGTRVTTGCVPRIYETPPVMKAVAFPTLDKSALLDRIRENKAAGSGLRNIRRTFLNGKPIPSLNQGQWGYCWAHSSTMAQMLVRAMMNLPYVPLSAFMVAATIKNGRNEGGWAALSMDFLMKHGTCSQTLWPQQDASLRWNTPQAQAQAMDFRVSEGFIDLDTQVYDRNLTYDQVLTLLACGVPVAADFYWWSHSVVLMDLVEVDGEPCPLGLNSWGDSYGDLGEFVLQGQRARPNGAVAPRAAVAAAGLAA